MATQAIGGIGAFWINGVSFGVKGSAKVMTAGDVRTVVTNAQGSVAGYTATYRPGGIELELNDRGDLSSDDINTLENATLVLENKAGKSWTLIQAFRSGDPISQDVMEGKFSVTFTGTFYQELPA